MNQEHESMRESVMDAINKGRVHMRPRWHFVLLSALLLIGVAIFALALAFAVSLLVFFLHESGAWFAPSFGARGWFAFFRSIPWLLILLLAVFILLLEVLVRRYSFVYKKPLLASVLGVVALVAIGGFAIAETPLHHQLELAARGGLLPSPMGDLYRPPFHMRAPEVYHGKIVSTSAHGFVIAENGESTSTIIITPHTRLPYGAGFAVGDTVVVVGDQTATDTVQAYGIRGVDAEPDLSQ